MLCGCFSFALQLAQTNYADDRGVKIDTELVQQAIACDLMLSDAMSKKAYELTGLENPNSVSQLKSWLDERGIPMDTLGKKDVAQIIDELDKNGVDAEAMDRTICIENSAELKTGSGSAWKGSNSYRRKKVSSISNMWCG